MCITYNDQSGVLGAEDESEFSYVEEDENGPARWGEIRAEWRMCTNGSMQSPIDLMSERVEVVSHVGMIKRSYHPSVAILKNRGHDIMVGFDKPLISSLS